MNKKSKEKYENVVKHLQDDFIRAMEKVGFVKAGLAAYGSAKDLVMVFQDKHSDDQYYVSCAALRDSIERHEYKNWKTGLIREIAKDRYDKAFGDFVEEVKNGKKDN